MSDVMRLVAVGALALGVGACGQAPEMTAPPPAPPELEHFASIDDAAIVDPHIFEVLVHHLQDQAPLNPGEIFLTVRTDPSETGPMCSGHEACGRAGTEGSYHILALWGPAPRTLFANLELLAHELCHAHYYQTTGDPDSQHTHAECFGRPTGGYGGGEGFGWQAAAASTREPCGVAGVSVYWTAENGYTCGRP